MIEWNGFERAGPIPSTVPLVAQAVLYHDSHEIALQYASVDDSLGGQATVGLQGLDGRAARTLGCNAPRLVRARQAVCFFDPGNGRMTAYFWTRAGAERAAAQPSPARSRACSSR
ncbi:hypothetical protein [Arenimonas daejeonensis]|uniref:hypothetical protein n=1 Tax=Arenimonas daejeonensis TaxID=370777 RepID=UPI0011BEC399|nr:hypothetical protein [Arenimonas daejeonensis]